MATHEKELITIDFPYEKKFDDSNIIPKLDLELIYLINDCLKIHKAIVIYNRLRDAKITSEYFEYANVLTEAFVYRIIIGLSKLFDKSKQSRSIDTILRKISSLPLFNSQKHIMDTVEKIRSMIDQFSETYNLLELRDTFFCHLDKDKTLSSLRKSLYIDYTNDLMKALYQFSEGLVEIYNYCFSFCPFDRLKLYQIEITIPNS